jgi:hypothetical protein
MAVIFKLTKWAVQNPKIAQFTIIGVFSFSLIFFFFLGLWIPEINTLPDFNLTVFLSLLTGLTLIVHKNIKCSFLTKKTILTFTYLLSFFLIIQATKQTHCLENNNFSDSPVRSLSVVYNVKSTKQSTTNQKFFKKKLIKIRNFLYKSLKSPSELMPVAAFFLYFILGIITIILAFFLAILSCSLSCGGQAIVATSMLISTAILGAGGIFLIVYAFICAFRKE